ncbi:cation-translocating P-type ATPase [Eubacterium multiforme]|uniref:Cation-transporting ATPase E n=1 Tax=Eubacterium multiforme TaxID=83339 RepID=A0ABT9UVJ3_9FIRM|nr:cation-translocating P-type ATPase [Eubacterium multiforme]MDQ0150296.1 cation-transporting ATPase E [Eubacterium multiforme]
MECREDQDRPVVNKIIGLTEEQVNERILLGEVNKIPKAPSKTFLQILRSNFFTMFNALNLVLAAAVIIAGSPKNAIFAGVIIVNSLIGVIQEVKAKNIIEKLSVISEAHCNVVRDGVLRKIGIEDIVKDDIIYITSGDQILADGVLSEGNELEIDESMLTGEADPIHKKEDDNLLSGSFVVAGEGYMRVTKVGANTYSSKLADEARKFKITNSELQNSLNKILKVLLILIVPIGIILATTQLKFIKASWQDAVIGTVSGIIGMVPEGLVLLTSATFIVAIIKLSQYDTLVQELSATEVLARVDVLCVDKTGTITEGALKLIDVVNLSSYKDSEIDDVLASIAHNLPSKNPTQQAVLDKYKEDSNFEIIEKVPFSSKRKWGGIVTKDKGTWIFGAPEIVMGNKYLEIKCKVEEEARKGRRVLVLAKSKLNSLRGEKLKEIEKAALVLIEDIIRKDAPETLKFFKDEGVNVKVISGDNPVTVSAVATRAGVHGAENYIDARELPEDMEGLKKEVEKYSVFGRVTPHQKKALVIALQENDHTVAMTGDGVNDVLALKEADCGIAMANGSDATKAVSQLVLMKSNFSALPKVVAEGRQQINNLERVAQLFLTKTTYSIILAVVFSILLLPFPIQPIQLSLIGSCAIGIPALFLAMLPNNERVKKGFLGRILTASIPNGVLIAIFVSATFVISNNYGTSLETSRTLAVLMLAGVSMVILFKVALPLTPFKIGLVILMMLIVSLGFITPIGRLIFTLTKLSGMQWLLSAGAIALSVPILATVVSLIRVKKNVEQ